MSGPLDTLATNPLQPARLLVLERPALDASWFAELHDLETQTSLVGLSTELFAVLGPPHAWIEAQRHRFESEGIAPSLLPHNIDTGKVRNSLQAITEFRHQVTRTKANLAVRRAYTQRLNELTVMNRLLVAAADNNPVAFLQANRAVYGSPNRKVFGAACAWLREMAASETGSHNPYVAKAAKQLLEVIPDVGGKAGHIIPPARVFKRVRDMHFAPGGYYEQLIGHDLATLPDVITAESGDPVVYQALAAIGSDYTVTDSSDELWGVVHHQRQVVRPAGYHLPKREFIGIVAHEIGSHLLERCNGQRQPLRLLGIGLDGYEASNEGRAFIREQIVYHSPYDMLREPAWEYIVLLHLAVSLAAGSFRQPYGFAELYRTILPVCQFFQTMRQPDNPVYAEVNARNEAWNLVVRILKGTDGQGGAYHKDMVYLEGAARAWRLARFNPSLIMYGDNGKFDITRREHRWIMRSLGIVPTRTPLPISFQRLRHLQSR